MSFILNVAQDWSLYSMLGLSLVIVFKATGVFNLALGSMLLIDGYLLYAVVEATGEPWLALLALLLIQVPFGLALYLIMRGLMARQALWPATILTLGLAVMLEAVASYVWKSTTYDVPTPFPSSYVHLSDSGSISGVNLVSIGVAVLLCVVIVAGLRFTKAGLALRVTGENPLLASQAGVNIRWVFALAWVAGLICAALGSAFFVYNNGTNPGVVAIGLGAIAPAMIGGLDSIGGVFLGAAVAALVQEAALRLLGGDALNFALFAIILVVLLIRPHGLFGTLQTERA